MLSKLLDNFDYKAAIDIYKQVFSDELTETEFREVITEMYNKAVELSSEDNDFVEVTPDNFLFLQSEFVGSKMTSADLFCKILEVRLEEETDEFEQPHQT